MSDGVGSSIMKWVTVGDVGDKWVAVCNGLGKCG